MHSLKSDITATLSTGLLASPLTTEIKSIGPTVYAKIPDLGFLADMLGGNTQAILPGDWVSFLSSDTAALGQTGVLAGNISSTQKTQIMQIFMQGGIITPSASLSRVNVGGVLMHHYQFSVNQDALKKAVEQSLALVSGTALTDAQSAAIDQAFSQFTVTNGEVWIGILDRTPHRIIFTIKMAGSIASEVQDLKFDISLDSLGKSVSVTAPSSSKSVLSVIQTVQTSIADEHIKTGLAQAVPQSLIYYAAKHSYVGICDADTGLKNIVGGLGASASYCKSTAKAFAVAAPLSTGQFACADTAGQVVDLASLPTGTVCSNQ